MDAAQSPSFVAIDLRGIGPKPERVVSVIREIVRSGQTAVAVDWDDRFPWSIEERLSISAFPEELVAAVGEEINRAGSRMFCVWRSVLPDGFSSIPAYRHLYDGACRGSDLPWPEGLAKLLSDLIDDMVAILPGVDGLALIQCPEGGNQEARKLLGEAARSAGLEVEPVDEVSLAAEWISAPDFLNDSVSFISGFEYRVAHLVSTGVIPKGCGHPSHGAIVQHGAELERWRSESWLAVARLHEAVVGYARGSSDRHTLDVCRKRLRSLLREGRRLLDRATEAYGSIGSTDAFSATVCNVAGSLEEQYLTLTARGRCLGVGR